MEREFLVEIYGRASETKLSLLEHDINSVVPLPRTSSPTKRIGVVLRHRFAALNIDIHCA